MKLTQQRLKEWLFYDHETGHFTRRIGVKGHAAGERCGTLMPNGRVTMVVYYKRYQAHRLAWLYSYGVWPSQEIDHINGDPSDNRLVNLRDVSGVENMLNIWKPTKRNSTGHRGVRQHRNKYQALIMVNGEQKVLGTFDTAEQASAAYVTAKNIAMESFV